MNQNSNAIITLCSHLCVGEGVVPLEPKEWGALAKRLLGLNLQPENLFELSAEELTGKLGLAPDLAERIRRLIDRNASLTFELSQYENMGITVTTRADAAYPARLKKLLGNNCPPLFYVSGDPALLDGASVGYVGSRTISEEDAAFTKATIQKTVERGFGVVSGGAKGIDQISEQEALRIGAPVVEFLSDSMLKKMRVSATVNAIRDGKLLLLSVLRPDSGFNVGVAMMRNRYIYAQSSGTIVIRSDYNKGGTWAGAMENLKYGWCKELCWNKKGYPGNQALVQSGAIPIDAQWDGDLDALTIPEAFSEPEQLRLFDD